MLNLQEYIYNFARQLALNANLGNVIIVNETARVTARVSTIEVPKNQSGIKKKDH